MIIWFLTLLRETEREYPTSTQIWNNSQCTGATIVHQNQRSLCNFRTRDNWKLSLFWFILFISTITVIVYCETKKTIQHFCCKLSDHALNCPDPPPWDYFLLLRTKQWFGGNGMKMTKNSNLFNDSRWTSMQRRCVTKTLRKVIRIEWQLYGKVK